MVEGFLFLISGIVFGLTAGISPGPLFALVVSETLKYGRNEGVKVAIAPLITDVPIVIFSIFLLSKLANVNFFLGIISFLGSIFIGYIAYQSIRTKTINLKLPKVKAQSLRNGVIVNALSPHPYLFWLVIGGPIVLKAYSISILPAVYFILSFYISLVGSKIVVAFIVDKSKDFLKSNGYVYIIKVLGIILLIFAIIFFIDGLKFFGILS